MMRKVLVTGAGGFIGRHTLDTLIEQGFEVHAVTSKQSPPVIDGDCTWHVANLLDLSQIKTLLERVRPSHLLHLAWYAVPGKYWTAEENFLWVQVSLELLRQFQEYGGQRVVMAGTCAEYDWKYGYLSEFVTPKQPDSPYGICKNALQEMMSSYSKQVGLSSAWGRIFFLYGPHEYPNRLVPSVIRSLLLGKPALCSHGKQIRDFLYVRDVADAFVAVLESDIVGAVNIASGQPIAIKEIVYKLAEKIGRAELIELGAIPVSAQEPHLIVADVTRLSEEVRWQPKNNLASGLDKTIAWFKN
jgi:nucleoside-diphosphate-sugar epimerase